MRVAPINHHLWYDRRLRTYDRELVGRTHFNSVDGTSVQVCIVGLHVFTTLEFDSNYLINLLWKIVKSRDHNITKLNHQSEKYSENMNQ